MTPEQAQSLHTMALGATMLGLVETLLGFVLGQVQQTRNIRYLLLFGGPGFLVAAAILYLGSAYLPTLIAAIVVVGIANNVGVLRMARALKQSAGDQLR